jgi:phosphotriesterase-related protein
VARIDRATLRGRVQTVSGLIAPDQGGPALMHEHLLIDLNPPRLRAEAVGGAAGDITLCNCFDIRWGRTASPFNMRLDSRELAITELRRMHAAGGRTLVDLTVGGLQPDPQGLAAIAAATGVQVVMGSGHYVQEYQDPALAGYRVEDFAMEIIGQVLEGAWGTEIRAGIIGEIGCQAPWTEQEKRVMRGAILAQAETGAALNVHPGRDADQPQEVAAFVRAHGGPMERLIISHIDRTIFDDTRLLRLADTGCVVEFDLFGWEDSYYLPSDAVDMPNDAARLRMLRTLLDHGHGERILISQDICTRTRLNRYGGHGYDHIFSNIVPLMRRRGFDEREIDTILVRNPRRLLTFV